MANAMLAHMAKTARLTLAAGSFGLYSTAQHRRLFGPLQYCLSGNREGSVST